VKRYAAALLEPEEAGVGGAEALAIVQIATRSCGLRPCDPLG
jgi:hypothetical protein